MLTLKNKYLAKFNKKPIRIISIMLMLIMLVSAVIIAIFQVFADDGGFSLEIKWMGTDDKTNFVYSSSEDEERLVRLRIIYNNASPKTIYNKGEMVITVNGIGKSMRDGKNPLAGIAADKASEATKKYDWSYTYSSSTDTYTLTNNDVIRAGNAFEGMFEIIWKVKSRDSIHDFSNEINAKLRTINNEQVKSNTLTYSQERTEDAYYISHSSKGLYSSEGLTGVLPSDKTHEDYTWVNYTLNGTDSYKARDINGTEKFVFFFAEGAIVQSTDHEIIKTGETKTVGEKNYEAWLIEKNVNRYTLNPWIQNVYVAYPKDKYDNDFVDSYVYLRGTYFDEDDETDEIAFSELSDDLSKYGYMDIPGNLYNAIIRSYGLKNSYIGLHDTQCYYYGAVSADHFRYPNTFEYYSNFPFSYFYTPASDKHYSAEFTHDFFDVKLKNGQLKQLDDSEYHYTKVTLLSTEKIKNTNNISLAPNVYPVEIYIRRKSQEQFETTPYSTEVLTNRDQVISLPEDTVGVRIHVKNLKESVSSSLFYHVFYKFHSSDSNIRSDSGKFYSNGYIKLYDSNGKWTNSNYGREQYESDREYLRDIDTYGESFDREFSWNHILEVPNDFRTYNTISNVGDDDSYFYLSGKIESRFNYLIDSPISKFSQYTIIPEGLELANNTQTEEALLNSLVFTSNQSDLTDSYIRDHCSVEIIKNYKDSGRTYIALHYDFSDNPVSPRNLTVSGISMFANKHKLEDVSVVYTMRAATLIDNATSTWVAYEDERDDKSLEKNLWADIDRDTDKEESASFDVNQITIENPLHSLLNAVKAVSTSSTTAYSSPLEEDGKFNPDEIPFEYFGNTYKYSLTATTGTSRTTNILLCDILEAEGAWQGKFKSIDYSDAANKLGVNPTVWYSDQQENIETEPDFNTGGWTTEEPDVVKSIALDFGSARLREGSAVMVYIEMEAPTDTSLLSEVSLNRFTVYYNSLNSDDQVSERKELTSNNVPVKLTPYLGTINLTKTDVVDNSLISGAKFDLYKKTGDQPDLGNDILISKNYVTDQKGFIKANKLEYGDYYFVETFAPSGYELPESEADRIFEVTLDSDKPDAYTSLSVTNQRKATKITFEKVNDRDTKIPVVGAVFSVYDSDGTLVQDGNDSSYNLVSDENGLVTVRNLPWGNYYLKEIKAPKGYELMTENVEFTLSAKNDSGHGLSTRTIKDPQVPASAVLTKYEVLEDGKSQTTITLDGAVYELYRVSGSVDYLIGSYMTNDDGKIYADDLAFGDYYFIETIAAQGYGRYEGKIEFSLTPDHTEASLEITTTDTRLKGSVWLKKTDTSDLAVKGAEYGLYNDENDTLKGTYKTNEEGIIEIDGLFWGEYYIVEITAPLGYEIDETEYKFSINRQTVNNKIYLRPVDERKKGIVKLIKESEDGILLSGAEFSLYRNDGSLVSEKHTTSDDGTVTVTDLDWGSYYFIETKAPLGYGLNPDKIRFSVNYISSGKTQEITVIDPEITLEIHITKRIKTSDVVLSHGNPTFTFKLDGTDIHNEQRTMYKTVTFDPSFYASHASDEYLEQTIIFTDLISGDYNVSEVNTQRYSLESIKDVSSGGVLNSDKKSVDFNDKTNGGAYSSYSATFVNEKTTQSLTSHTSQITNVIAKQAKLTTITAIWNGGEVTNEVLDRSKLDVYATYDDGHQVKLANDDYTLDPERFDPSQNGDYTVNVSYEEGGITRTDSFNLRLNVPVPFTWVVLSEEPYEYEGRTYDGTVAISGYTGTSSVVDFPKEVTGKRTWDDVNNINHIYEDDGNTYRVTQIGSGSKVKRADSQSKVEIIIPEGVTKIAKKAFYSADRYGSNIIGNLTIPGSVKTIDIDAFRNCRYLTSLELENGIEEIGMGAFEECKGFTGNLIIPDSVTKIGDNAFNNCTGFNGTLTLSNQLETIGEYAFSGCSKLMGSLVIPDSVTLIDAYAFNACKGFDKLTIGNNVITIGNNAFWYCTGFNGDLVIPDSVTSIGDFAFSMCNGFDGTLTLGSSLDSIGEEAFSGCTGFKGNLVIPDSVISIGDFAFSACSGFDGTLTLGSSLDSIGEEAFSMCTGFKGSLVIPDSLTSIGELAFAMCEGFDGTLTIGSGLKKISAGAFGACTRFTGSLVIPDSVTSIGVSAFMDCYGFTGSLIIPDSVTSIDHEAFNNCYGLKGTLTLGNGLGTIGDNAFDGCEFTGSLVIPDSVTSIGKRAFYYCTELSYLTIGNNVATIGNYAFDRCFGLKGELVIPESVTSIGENAFYLCSFNNLTFNESNDPEAKLTIGKSCFSGCGSIVGVVRLPKYLTSVGVNSFSGCTGITRLEMPRAVETAGGPTCGISVEYYD